jgi:predicted transcriptional regulator
MEDKEVFSAQANLCRAMANSTRIEIVHLLRDQPLRVSDIARRIDCPQPRGLGDDRSG